MEDNDLWLLNDVYREIAECLGIESAKTVYRLYKGQQITFPIHLYDSKLIRLSIVGEYDGINVKELARKYGYSEKTVRRIIRDSKK